jgi:molybdate transport system ATP-binding protein
MTLELEGVRLPLASFALELDAVFDSPVVGVFGPSGSGKTSLLEVVAGLRRPERGWIRLDGETLDRPGSGAHVRASRRRIGYVSQDDTLFPHLSVRRNLLYGARRAEGRAVTSLERVAGVLELEDLLGRGVSRLSGGERSRVSLGRVLLSAPRLLLLDEPLTGLDQALRSRSLELLRTIRDEFRIPTLYVTHNSEEVLALCDEVLLLDRGRVTGRGAPSEWIPVAQRNRKVPEKGDPS